MSVEATFADAIAQEDFKNGAAPDENPYPADTEAHLQWQQRINNLYHCEWLEQQRKNAQGIS